jgi:hypothetical protein
MICLRAKKPHQAPGRPDSSSQPARPLVDDAQPSEDHVQPSKDEVEQAEFVLELEKKLSYQNLPREVRDNIPKQVARTPSWLWFQFEAASERHWSERELAGSQDYNLGLLPTPTSVLQPQGRPVNLRVDANLHRLVVVRDLTAKFTNREVDVSREFRDPKFLQEGRSRSGYTDKMHWLAQSAHTAVTESRGAPASLEQRLIDINLEVMEKHKVDMGHDPFVIQIDHQESTPPVRRDVDWFYIPGILTCWLVVAKQRHAHMPYCVQLADASHIVLDLTDLYHAMCIAFGGHFIETSDFDRIQVVEPNVLDVPRGDPSPWDITLSDEPVWWQKHFPFFHALVVRLWFLFTTRCAAKDIRVLIGAVPHDPTPDKFEEVEVKWSQTEERASKTECIKTAPRDVSAADKRKIGWINSVLEDTMRYHTNGSINSWGRIAQYRSRRVRATPEVTSLICGWVLGTDGGGQRQRMVGAGSMAPTQLCGGSTRLMA